MYGISEYLLIMHEVQRARLADQARRAGAESDARYRVIPHDKRLPEVKARFGLEAPTEAGSKGATR